MSFFPQLLVFSLMMVGAKLVMAYNKKYTLPLEVCKLIAIIQSFDIVAL